MRPRSTMVAVAVMVMSTGLAACTQDDDVPKGQGPSPSAFAGAASRATLTVTKATRQRMAGFGLAVASDSVFDPWGQTDGLDAAQVRRLDALVLRSGVRLVRIFGPGQITGPAGVQVWTPADARLRLMRRLRGRGFRFVFTGQGAPADMVVGGGLIGALKEGQEARYAGFLALCLDVARRAGTPFEFAAIGNEVDNAGDSGVSLTEGQAAAVTAALAREIDRRRLRARLVLGDTLNWRSTVGYGAAQARALGDRRPAFVATHGYGEDGARPDLARFAAAQRLPVWMTEWVSACPNGECPDDPSIAFALRWAQQIHDDLTTGTASAWFMFRGVADSTHGADGAIIVRDRGAAKNPLTTTKRYPVVRQFATAAPPGSRRLVTRLSAGATVQALAFSSANRRSVVLTNLGESPMRLRVVLGSRRGELRGWRTSATESYRPVLRRRLARGRIDVTLAPQSVTTLILRKPG